tara:strand:- start:445 stop:624 length:180 start_codon:yes stop_codon:yes gene_type:complete
LKVFAVIESSENKKTEEAAGLALIALSSPPKAPKAPDKALNLALPDNDVWLYLNASFKD